MYIFSLSLYIGFFAILSKCVSIYLTQRRRLRESERHGCAPPPTVSTCDPLGIMSVISAARANREGRSPRWFMELMDKISPDTLTVRGMVLDTEIIITRDPSLVQFILQTESNKWDIGPQRKEIWSPLLGDAIFTAQGMLLGLDEEHAISSYVLRMLTLKTQAMRGNTPDNLYDHSFRGIESLISILKRDTFRHYSLGMNFKVLKMAGQEKLIWRLCSTI